VVGSSGVFNYPLHYQLLIFLAAKHELVNLWLVQSRLVLQEVRVRGTISGDRLNCDELVMESGGQVAVTGGASNRTREISVHGSLTIYLAFIPQPS